MAPKIYRIGEPPDIVYIRYSDIPWWMPKGDKTSMAEVVLKSDSRKFMRVDARKAGNGYDLYNARKEFLGRVDPCHDVMVYIEPGTAFFCYSTCYADEIQRKERQNGSSKHL